MKQKRTMMIMRTMMEMMPVLKKFDYICSYFSLFMFNQFVTIFPLSLFTLLDHEDFFLSCSIFVIFLYIYFTQQRGLSGIVSHLSLTHFCLLLCTISYASFTI